ncbi:TetR/AcrR family transcriptional regulator [Gordonia sp. (in: high G+C Gram-positive bacteria)]|uniref:TetR/AcrR family transcriptional regulator n=1 Tax=Gordonia sp. (in: high G+C Gram-positive bacteria) TaxID=84139 RepID=UPI0039E503BD
MPARTQSRSQLAKKDAYRRVVLECAEELFADGIDNTKVEDIAAAAGIAPRTLYSVFDGKQQIIDAVCDGHRRALVAHAETVAAPATTPLEALILGVRGANQYFVEHPNYLKMELRESRAWSSENPSFSPIWYQTFDTQKRLFDRCIADGSVRAGDADAYARALLAIQQSQLAHWVDENEPTGTNVSDRIEDLVVHAFATNPDAH